MAQIKKSSYGSATQKQGYPLGGEKHKRRTNWHVWLIGFFLLISFFMFKQSPKPAPYKPPSLGEQVFYPYERNAFARLPLVSGKINNLHYIENTDTIWLVGDAGLILVSHDAGFTWQQRTFVNGPDISVVQPGGATSWFSFVADANAGAESKDGVVSKPSASPRLLAQSQQQQSVQQRPLRTAPLKQPSKQPPPQQEAQQQQGQLQIDAGPSSDQAVPTVEVTVDTPPLDIPGLNAVKFLDSSLGIIVGDAGTILLTRDGGETWSATDSGVGTVLFDLEFTPAGAVVVGAAGVILESEVPYSSWSNRGLQDDIYLQAVDYKDGYALIVGSGGTILQGSEFGTREKGSGSRWQQIYSRGLRGREWFYAVSVTQPGAGTVVGSQGSRVRIEQGSVGNVSAALELYRLKDLVVLADNSAIAVGQDGTVNKLDAGSGEWQNIDYKNQVERTNISSQYNAIAALGGGQLMVVGDDGVILRSNDNGLTWFRASIDVPYFLANSLSQGGIDASPSNAGSKTDPIKQRLNHDQAEQALLGYPYSSFPAIWYWFACLLVGLVSVLLSRQASPLVDKPSKSITDALASDKPLEPNQPDPLKFGAISKGLSRFIRNPSTTPPLTTAITGQWGTGKSSLMNLLYHDLKGYGFTPVWFNAWHHQKGEQLLASLYANIRNQAIPKLFYFSSGIPVGLLFRFNLLINRIRRNRTTALLLLLIFLGPLFYFVSGVEMSLEEFWVSLQEGDEEGFKTLLIGILGSTPLAALIKTLQGFGLDPVKLVSMSATASPNAKLDPSARQKFAAEFEQVTQSLELGRMVIFIDDLDRCSKENVVDILEAINFLSVSGNCYIVLGMDEKWVKLCVSDHFDKIAEDDPSFAENYLEKMINIKVPVPSLGSGGVRSLLAPLEESSTERSPVQRLREAFLEKMNFVWKPGAVLAILLAAYFLFDPQDQMMIDPVAAPVNETFVLKEWKGVQVNELSFENGEPRIGLDLSGENSASSEQTPAESYDLQLIVESTKQEIEKGILLGQLGTATDSPLVSVRLISGASSDTGDDDPINPGVPDPASNNGVAEFYTAESGPPWLVYILPAIIMVILLWGLIIMAMKRPDRIVIDSADFSQALAIWQDWILLEHRTPRALKRFLNNIRYIAMRYRPAQEAEEPTVWGSVRGIFSRAQSALNKNEDQGQDVINEAGLVALSAIYSVNPAWVRDESNFSAVENGSISSLLKSGTDLVYDPGDELSRVLEQTAQAHRSTFVEFVSDRDRQKFLEIVDGK